MWAWEEMEMACRIRAISWGVLMVREEETEEGRRLVL